MANVRPPGYYTSWFHFVANLPAQQNVNLYDYIVKNSSWNSESKKLNAIITIPEGVTISARDITTKIDESGNPSVIGTNAAIYIPATLPFGQGSFREYDRITIINKGTIKGAYAFRDYGGENSSFTPPAEVKNGLDNISDQVSSVFLEVRGGGGGGGGACNSLAGSGGGGGGSGGRSAQTVTVTPGIMVVSGRGLGGSGSSNNCSGCSYNSNGGNTYANDGGNSFFSQNGSNIILATGGKGGQCGKNGGRYEKRDFFGFTSATWYRKSPNSSGGAGGTPGGTSGGTGTGGDQASEKSGDAPRGKGGSGGANTNHSSGGRGAKARRERNQDDGVTEATSGENGLTRFSYTRRELFGPALAVNHNNFFIDNNDGKIIGGYPNINNVAQTKWAVYGGNNIKAVEGKLSLVNTNVVGQITTALI